MTRREVLKTEIPRRPRSENDITAPDWVPVELAPLFEKVMCELPAFPDRRTFADVWSRNIAPLSHRTVEADPLATRRINGRACFNGRRPPVEYHFRKLLNAPVVTGGHKSKTDQHLGLPAA
jgi:hypothetical protein